MLEGLKRLEYRGYDSAGLAVLQENAITLVKCIGRVAALAKLASSRKLSGTCGISHTRWATHGGVTDANAHPHVSSDGQIALVHNGVIENYIHMKRFLLDKGYTFKSETDTEVLANLIAYHYAKQPAVTGEGSRFLEAVRKTLLHVEGTYGIAVLSPTHPGELVAARKGSPLILGVGDHEHLIASDVSALVSRTQNVVYLKDGELVHITPAGFTLSTLDLADVSPVIDQVTWSVDEAELGEHPHFMRKEIFEQPLALENAMRGRFSADGSTANFGGLNLAPADFRTIDRFVFLLRHRLARLPGGGALDRTLRPHTGRGGLRLGVPLPQRPARPRRPVLRYFPVGRDDRHPRRPARSQAQGLQVHGHLQRRRLHHRPRGRRRHLPARRP
jgi:glucosamine--fructose-6-phosphate aminotransferase (isomerizing)